MLKQLNDQQKKAVSQTEGPSMILAGAGSGKTRVLVSKVVGLITEKKIASEEIVMITFTNKAASEMKERIGGQLGSSAKSILGYVGTFHSFCSRIMRREAFHAGFDPGFSIYDDDDSAAIIKKLAKDNPGKKYSPSFINYRISAAKNQMVTPGRYTETFADYSAPYIAEIYRKYQAELKKSNAMDFDDLIMHAVNLLSQQPDILAKYQRLYRYLLVDEFQDTNVAQYALTKLLGEKSRNVTVVGDFSQSIYSWRGADIRNLQKFSEDFPEAKTYNLDRNYRSTQTILDYAYNVIAQNQTHPILKLHTKNRKGEDIFLYEAENEQDEAVFVANTINKVSQNTDLRNIAVLYRTNAQSRTIEEAFLHYGIPYTLVGGTRFYERREIKDVLSYLRLVSNPKDEAAQERIEKIGKRKWEKFKSLMGELREKSTELSTAAIMEKIFTETDYLTQYNPEDPEDYGRLENIKELKSVAIKFKELRQFLEQVALVESEYFQGEKNSNQGVRLMTLHQAKGLEFNHVFIVGCEEGIIPHSRSAGDLFELEEERRLLYVGITRAKERLYITYAKQRFIFGRRYYGSKSRFISNSEEPTSSPYGW